MPLWFVPLAIAVVGAIPVLATVRRVAREAHDLRRSVAALGDVQTEVRHVWAALPRHGGVALPKRGDPGATTAP